MAIGPSLPPHLQQKRKREDDPESSAAPTPQPLPLPASGSTKRRCVLGPSLPLESPGETAAASPKISVEDEASSDNESDFGPAPASNALSSEYRSAAEAEATAQQETVPAEPEQPQRDDWMLTPPTHGDWVSRVDPTKLRNRKFKTGKGTKAPGDVSSADNRLWTETPEQKRHRLEDEVMGVKKPAAEVQAPKKSAAADAEDRATERKIQEFNKDRRDQSLVQQHKKRTPQAEDDDPSKRAFDREKDIGGGTISFTKRREMMSKAADFGSRFSKGSYL